MPAAPKHAASRPRRRRRLATAFALLLLTAAAVGAPALAEPEPTPEVLATLAPDGSGGDVRAGTTSALAVTLDWADEESASGMESARIELPDGFALPADGPAPESTAGTAAVDDGAIVVTGLGPDDVEVVVSFHAVVACKDSQDAEALHTLAVSAEDAVGGALAVADDGAVAVTVTGACALAFVTEPADAEVDATITGERGDEAGDPVTVEVRDDDGEATAATATVDVALADGSPGDATLDGTLSRAAEDGAAEFDDLSLDVAARGYALSATSAVADAATSRTFQIWEDIESCAPGEDCALSLDRPGSMSSAVRGASGQGGALYSSISDRVEDAPDCGQDEPGYPFNHAPSTVIVDSDGIDEVKVATLTIDGDVVREHPNNGVSFYQVCFQALVDETDPEAVAEAEFVPRDPVRTPGRGRGGSAGEAPEPTLGPALLPDCGPGNQPATPPCVQSRTGGPGGAVIITVLLPAHDPMFR